MPILQPAVTVTWHSLPGMSWSDVYPAERLAPPDVAWQSRYAEISAGLRQDLGPGWTMEHVGSTSVPGLVAKPVIDLALRLPQGCLLADTSAWFARAGWTAPVVVGDHWATFLLIDEVRSAIGHIFRPEQWSEAHVRLFAEWLRTHPADRDSYADLKRALVERGTWGSDYTTAKGAFVLEVVNRARAARGLPSANAPR
jgi:GrpB-like predicted nucleotidyltransferase (UPF0157 family)